MALHTGRFAPTPSGDLHLGSLVAALGSYLDAKSAGGSWLIRIDDLDRPRIRPGSEDKILRQLEAHGLHWDGRVFRQSEHQEHYRFNLDRLEQMGITYACTCSRRKLWRLLPEAGPAAYPGFCRARNNDPVGAAIRLNTQEGLRASAEDWPAMHDFVICRRDGIFGYELACAVDELVMRVTHVVRGMDLSGSTIHQKLLIGLLGQALPSYTSLPLVLRETGEKLSKRCETHSLDSQPASANLKQALSALGQLSEEISSSDSVDEILRLAINRWSAARIPKAPYILR